MTTTANQPPPLEPYNLYTSDPVLDAAVRRHSPGPDPGDLARLGAAVGSAEVFAWGHEANRNPPELLTHDRYGERLDEVQYHPAYHALMAMSVGAGLHCSHHEPEARPGALVARNARAFLMGQVEAGHGCPISMTSSVIGSLRHQPELADVWVPRILSRAYDPELRPPGTKSGVLFGMGMTERRGGSDVRSNESTATPAALGGPGGEYRLAGHKWFTSAPMSDAFLMLAHAPAGLSCFLVPRMLEDGTSNPLRFQRLKDKLGNRSNASAEVEFTDVAGWMVGEEGRGVRTIIEMVNATRMDCVVWSAALMRQAVAQAAWHVAHRAAFGSVLIDKPLMQNVLADLEIETEAATLMMVRLSGAIERSSTDEFETALARLGTPIAKYWVTKRATPVVREAMECLGGNGYVEESILPRLYREAPVNAIWEGSGNVIALDVVRAVQRNPGTGDAFIEELRLAGGCSDVLDSEIESLASALAHPTDVEAGARILIERLAVEWAGALLVRHGIAAVTDAFIASRIGGAWGSLFGTLAPGGSLATIARRAVPAV